MATVAQLFDQYLKGVADVSDPIYRAIWARSEVVPPVNPTGPNDLDIGAVSNIFEWTRKLSRSLIDQLNLQNAEGVFLEFLAWEVMGIPRYKGETDDDWRRRIGEFLLNPKKSKAAIILIMRQFSPGGEPLVLSAETDSAFADVTYSDFYETVELDMPGTVFDGIYVLPAYTAGSNSNAYYFLLVLFDTPANRASWVLDYAERWKAAGIDYDVRIEAAV